MSSNPQRLQSIRAPPNLSVTHGTAKPHFAPIIPVQRRKKRVLDDVTENLESSQKQTEVKTEPHSNSSRSKAPPIASKQNQQRSNPVYTQNFRGLQSSVSHSSSIRIDHGNTVEEIPIDLSDPSMPLTVNVPTETKEMDIKPKIKTETDTNIETTKANVYTPFHDNVTGELLTDKFLFFQLPPVLPITSLENTETAQPKEEDIQLDEDIQSPHECESLQSPSVAYDNTVPIPDGYAGKIRVHKSGKVTLTIGNTTFLAVNTTSPSVLEEVWALSLSRKQCNILGNVEQHITLMPDLTHNLE